MGFQNILRRLALTLPLIAATGLAVSAPTSAASSRDSLTLTNAAFPGFTLNGTATSAPDIPIPATGTITCTGPCGSPSFIVSCLNVVDPLHAYVGLTESTNSAVHFVVLFTVGSPDSQTQYIFPPASDCAQPNSLSAFSNGSFDVTSGSVQIVDASTQNAQGQNNDNQAQNQK